MLRCPGCAGSLKIAGDEAACADCGTAYPRRRVLPSTYPFAKSVNWGASHSTPICPAVERA